MLLYYCLIAQTVFSEPIRKQNQLTGEESSKFGNGKSLWAVCLKPKVTRRTGHLLLEASAAPQESPAMVPAHSLCSPQKGCTAARQGCAEFTQERLTGQLS